MTVRVRFIGGEWVNFGRIHRVEVDRWVSTKMIDHTNEDGTRWLVPFHAVEKIIVSP